MYILRALHIHARYEYTRVCIVHTCPTGCRLFTVGVDVLYIVVDDELDLSPISQNAPRGLD